MIPTQPESSWEQRFESLLDMRFVAVGIWKLGGLFTEATEIDIKNAITSVLLPFLHKEIEAAEERGKLKGIKIGNATGAGYKRGIEQGRRDVLEELEGKLPSKQLPDDGNGDEDSYNFGFNYFRTTVLKLIKSIKGE